MPSFLAGKGKAHTGGEQPIPSNPAPVSSSSHHVSGVEDSATTQIARDQQSPIPRVVGDGTRDSPIALLDDGDPKAESDEYYEASAKRMKMANGERVGVPGITQLPTVARAENGDNSRKRKHANIAEVVRC